MGQYNYFIVELEPQYVHFMRFDEKIYIKVEPEITPAYMQILIKEFGGIHFNLDNTAYIDEFFEFLQRRGYNAEQLDIAWVDGRNGKSSK